MKLLEGKIAFVTGASRGIGREIAAVFARHGAQVVAHGRDEAALASLCDELEAETGRRPEVLVYDVRQTEEIKRAFQHIHARYRGLDILVNNAGIQRDALLGFVQPPLVEETMQVNLHAPIYHMQLAARLMARRGGGSIINIGSIFGTEGEAGQVVYAASKAALAGATKSAAKELAPSNIRVNAIAPGFIATEMTARLTEEQVAGRLANIRMGRAGTPADVAGVALFLASPLSSYVTGQVIGVDGGMRL